MLEPRPCLICTHEAYTTVSMAITSDAYLPAFICLEQINSFQAGFIHASQLGKAMHRE